MTISSVILGQAPILYWPLDDVSGNTAADASGNARDGSYRGAFALQQPGPETGTFAALLQEAGGILSKATSPKKTVPWSVSAWVAPVGIQAANNVVAYNGLSNSTGAGLCWGTASSVAQGEALLRGGVGIGGSVGAMLLSAWHHVAQTWDATGKITEYLDGVNLVSSPGVTYNAIGAVDPFVAGAASLTGQLVYMAHVTLFSFELAAAQVTAQYTGAAAIADTGGITGTQASAQLSSEILALVGTNDATILAQLAAILAAVRKTY